MHACHAWEKLHLPICACIHGDLELIKKTKQIEVSAGPENSGLFMPSHLRHCTKQKYYAQYRQKMIYKQFQDRALSHFREVAQWKTSSAEPLVAFLSINTTHHTAKQPLDSLYEYTNYIRVANISAWRRSVFPRSKLVDLLNMVWNSPYIL